MGSYVFKETQRIGNFWLRWFLVLIFVTILIFATVSFWSRNDPITFGEFIPLILGSVILYVVVTFKMVTIIAEKEILLRIVPFTTKRFLKSEIENVEIIDFGNAAIWGYGKYSKYGVIYALRGKKGLQVKSKGETIVIGTQKEKEIRSSIAHLLK